MPELTVGRMAKLYGMHRSSLYEAVQKSRVTSTFNGKGQRVIELSEMIRVYGEPPGSARQNPTLSEPPADTSPTPQQAETLGPLLEELRALREEVRELRQAMLRLPAPPATDTPAEAPDRSQEAQQEKAPMNDDPHGFRSLVQALRQSEGQ